MAPSGSAILDGPAGDLVSLEGCALSRQAGNGRRLASGWFPAVLALALETAWLPAEDHSRNSRADSALGAGELRLGRAENPRRIAEARLRALREDRRALLAADPSPGGSGQEMAGLSSPSPRGDRGPRLVYRADRDLPCVVRFLRHRARAPQDSALQSHAASISRLGRAATARNFCRGG